MPEQQIKQSEFLNEEEHVLSVNYIPDGKRILKLRKEIHLKLYRQGNIWGYACSDYNWNYQGYTSMESAKQAFIRNFVKRYWNNRELVFDVMEVFGK